MSRLYPDTRDQRIISNSNAKTLLDNWVEQRAVDTYDRLPQDYDKVPVTHYKNGHKCLLTINDSQPLNTRTTYINDFIAKDLREMSGETKGIRYQTTEKDVTLKLLAKMEEEENLKNDWKDDSTQFVSETQEKYFRPGFKHVIPEPKFKHDLYSEMPISYWTERRNRVHGVSQMKTFDSPFRKNTAFSNPGSESLNQVKPYEYENYPNFSQHSNNNPRIM